MQQQQDDLNKSIGEFIGKIYENIFTKTLTTATIPMLVTHRKILC